ncbi:DUF4270 domain-containing protein [Sunxiuqinia indica]|uniref:DUF4270 domain-containing protein n=1 Tax=Sunxiuqinia indica TaxID=2692584 RepID=UPI00135C5AB7|nr:DUF4270 domain-containing protein [Sunxiuqinia indica]
MNRKQIKPAKLAVAFMLLAFALWNCKDDPNGTGMELLPGSDLKTVGQSVDSESIEAFTEKDGPLKTDEPNYNVFGTFNDPVFGKTTADMAFHVRLPGYPGYADTLQLDSVVLYLLYKEFYGDTITTQSLKVYKLQEDIYIDTLSDAGASDYSYYQDVDLKSLAFSTPVGELDFIPKLELDSTGTDTLVQELAIRLDDSVAEELYNADSTQMVNNDTFLDFFKGFYVEPQDIENGGGLVRISTLSAGSNLTLFYSDHEAETDTLIKQYTFSYGINSSSARISSYTHDYSGTAFADQLGANQSEPDSLIYLQTLGGLRAKINIPNLDDWKDSVQYGDYVINKAQLIFQVDTLASDYQTYSVPPKLALFAIDETYQPGEDEYLYFPYDYGVSPNLYGGFFYAEDATYRFNITNHLQAILENEEVTNDGFYLSTLYQNEQTRRVVLKGSTSHVGIRLGVTYTKLN